MAARQPRRHSIRIRSPPSCIQRHRYVYPDPTTRTCYNLELGVRLPSMLTVLKRSASADVLASVIAYQLSYMPARIFSATLTPELAQGRFLLQHCAYTACRPSPLFSGPHPSPQVHQVQYHASPKYRTPPNSTFMRHVSPSLVYHVIHVSQSVSSTAPPPSPEPRITQYQASNMAIYIHPLLWYVPHSTTQR